MQVPTKKMKDSDDTSGCSGGRPVQPQHQVTPAPTLCVEDARVLQNIYASGGAKNYVLPRNMTLRDIARLNTDGVIETMDFRGKAKIRLTVKGQQLLPHAAQIIAATPGSRA